MKKQYFESLQRGMAEARAFLGGEREGFIVHEPGDVRAGVVCDIGVGGAPSSGLPPIRAKVDGGSRLDENGNSDHLRRATLIAR